MQFFNLHRSWYVRGKIRRASRRLSTVQSKSYEWPCRVVQTSILHLPVQRTTNNPAPHTCDYKNRFFCEKEIRFGCTLLWARSAGVLLKYQRYLSVDWVCAVVVTSVCVCVLSFILQGSSVRSLRRLGYVCPAPQAAPKDLVVIYSCGSTWGDLFRSPPVPSWAQRL